MKTENIPIPSLKQPRKHLVQAVQLGILTATLTLISGGRVDAAPTGSVIVTNSPSNPVPVRDVDNPARQPFEALLAFDIPDGISSDEQFFTVPAGKRLVMEFVTATLNIPAGQKLTVNFFSVTPPFPGGTNPGALHSIVVTPQGVFGTNDNYRASQQMRVYADPGTNVLFQVVRNASSGAGAGNISVTGYLVP